MLGMLQIITYLLCIYLVFKGFEILQIALVNRTPENRGAFVLGLVLLVISFAVAIGFTVWITVFAEELGNRMNSIPQIR